MRNFDDLYFFSTYRSTVLDEQSRFSEAIDEWPRLGRDLGPGCDAAHKLACRVNAGQVRDEGLTDERELILLILRQLALASRLRKSLIDGRLNDPLVTANLFITFMIQLGIMLVPIVEVAQREGEQCQRILACHVL